MKKLMVTLSIITLVMGFSLYAAAVEIPSEVTLISIVVAVALTTMVLPSLLVLVERRRA